LRHRAMDGHRPGEPRRRRGPAAQAAFHGARGLLPLAAGALASRGADRPRGGGDARDRRADGARPRSARARARGCIRAARRGGGAVRPRGAGRRTREPAPAAASPGLARRARRRGRRRAHRPAAVAARRPLRRADGERDRARAAAAALARLDAAGDRRDRRRARSRRLRHRRDLEGVPRPGAGPVRRDGMSVAVEAQDLFRVHSTPEGDAAALQGLTLTVAEGEILTVLGPSGAGKTSFLRILAGLDLPSAGTIRVFGENLRTIGRGGRARYRSRVVGYLDQHYERAL